MIKIKKFLKQVISAVLAGAVIITAVPDVSVQVSAAAKTVKTQKYDVTGFVISAQEKEFEKELLSAFANFKDSIDVTKYLNSYGWSKDFIMTEYLDTLYDNPQVFYVGKSIKFSSVGTKKLGTTNALLSDILYSFDAKQYSAKKAELDAAFTKFVNYASAGSTDVEKALLAHDYLVNTITYDVDSMNNSASSPPVATTAYSALVRKKAVCDGYAAAFKLAMNYFGIPCEVISSNALNHAWNYIKIGNSWYHVDATKDDPITLSTKVESFGQVSHDRFLISDAAAKKLKYKGWDKRGLPAANSTTYDNGFWHGVGSNVVKIKDKFYYLKLDEKSPAVIGPDKFKKESPDDFNNNFFRLYTDLYEYTAKTNKSKKLLTIDSTWFSWGTEDSNSKLWTTSSFASLGQYKNTLYYSTSKSINKFNLSSKKGTVVKDLSKAGGYCYGFVIDGDTISYTVKKDVRDKDSIKKYKIA